MKILRNAYGQRIGARSITYNCEKCKLSSITAKVYITSLIHTRLDFTLAQYFVGVKTTTWDEILPKGQKIGCMLLTAWRLG